MDRPRCGTLHVPCCVSYGMRELVVAKLGGSSNVSLSKGQQSSLSVTHLTSEQRYTTGSPPCEVEHELLLDLNTFHDPVVHLLCLM